MKIRVLGAAAGGGFPQWNCNCRNCEGLRTGSIRSAPRTQSSIAITSDSKSWVLINVSPDVLHQIRCWPAATSRGSIRNTAIAAIVLADSQLDHVVGLLMLREGDPLRLYTTAAVRDDLTEHLPIMKVLEKYCGIDWVEIRPKGSFAIADEPELRFRALPVVGKAPPYSPGRLQPREGDNICIVIEDARTGRTVLYAPGIAAFDDTIREEIARADCVLVDGTFWTDNELISSGVGHKRASDMNHLALSGDCGLIAELRTFSRPRRILVHVNNTNPILDDDSAERHTVEAAGIEVAWDGMEIDL